MSYKNILLIQRSKKEYKKFKLYELISIFQRPPLNTFPHCYWSYTIRPHLTTSLLLLLLFYHNQNDAVLDMHVVHADNLQHYNDVITSVVASQITSLTIVYSTVYSEKTSKLRVTGLCEGNSPVTGEFPTQRASNAENVSIWWRHDDFLVWKWHV